MHFDAKKVFIPLGGDPTKTLPRILLRKNTNTGIFKIRFIWATLKDKNFFTAQRFSTFYFKISR